MSVLWHKLWFDLWERKTRTLLVIISVAAGVFSIGTIFGMNDQLIRGMDSAPVSYTHLTLPTKA